MKWRVGREAVRSISWPLSNSLKITPNYSTHKNIQEQNACIGSRPYWYMCTKVVHYLGLSIWCWYRLFIHKKVCWLSQLDCYTSVCRRNRDAKQVLEMDWSDKKEADELDTKAVNLRNEHTNKQFHPGAARFQEMHV